MNRLDCSLSSGLRGDFGMSGTNPSFQEAEPLDREVLHTQNRLLFASEFGNPKVLWVLASVTDNPRTDCQQEAFDAAVNRSELFALALSLFVMGCRASVKQAKAFLSTRFHRLSGWKRPT